LIQKHGHAYFALFLPILPKTGQKLRNFKENDEKQAQNGLYLEENGAFEPKCPQMGEVQIYHRQFRSTSDNVVGLRGFIR